MTRAFRLLVLCLCLASPPLAAQAAGQEAAPGPLGDEAAPVSGEFKVLFAACTPGRPHGPGLFIADSDFSDPVRITTSGALAPDGLSTNGCDSGAWSPDGRRVAMVRSGLLYLLDLRAIAELPDQQPVPVRGPDGKMILAWSPAWSPDGGWLAFHDDVTGLFLARPDGTGYRNLVAYADGFTFIREAEFSPDGRSIAIRAGTKVPHHIYLVSNLFGPGRPTVTQVTRGEYQDSWPHFSPDGAQLMFTRATKPNRNLPCGEVWVRDLKTGRETQISHSPDGGATGFGWCPFDNSIYYAETSREAEECSVVVRVAPDGSEQRFDTRTILPIGRITWANTGAWVDSATALPGEQVKVQVGMQDAEELVEAMVDLRVGELQALGASRGRTIPHWNMLEPVQSGDLLSLHAHALDPDAQHVSGPAHLFDVWLDFPSTAKPEETWLLGFSGLSLMNRLGQPLPRLMLSGAVLTLPFAALRLDIDSERPREDGGRDFTITVQALDRQGQVMAGCNMDVGLACTTTGTDPTDGSTFGWVTQLSPGKVTLRNGAWSGPVTLPFKPTPGSRLLVYWGDLAGYSGYLVPKQQ